MPNALNFRFVSMLFFPAGFTSNGTSSCFYDLIPRPWLSLEQSIRRLDLENQHVQVKVAYLAVD